MGVTGDRMDSGVWSGFRTWPDFILILLACTGNISLSAQSAGLSRQLVCHWRDTDRLFAESWAAAEAQFSDQLRYAAFQRGVEGRREPVFYQGQKIGERVLYSDPLLLYLLQLADTDSRAASDNQSEAERDQLLAQIAAQMAALCPDSGPDTGPDTGPRHRPGYRTPGPARQPFRI